MRSCFPWTCLNRRRRSWEWKCLFFRHLRIACFVLTPPLLRWIRNDHGNQYQLTHYQSLLSPCMNAADVDAATYYDFLALLPCSCRMTFLPTKRGPKTANKSTSARLESFQSFRRHILLACHIQSVAILHTRPRQECSARARARFAKIIEKSKKLAMFKG